MTAELWLLFGLCLGVGILSAVIGVGGGVLLVPAFTLLFKLPIIEAVALSLCCVLATSVTATTRYLNSDLVDVGAGLNLEITTIIGSYLAGKLAGLVPAQFIASLLSLVLIIVAVLMLLPRLERESSVPVSRGKFSAAAGVSVFAGGLVGFLGIGGGIVKVPILQFFLGKSTKQAVATSSMMLGISAAVAVIPYLERDNIPFNYVPFAALGAIAGAFLGAQVMPRVKSLYIKLLFAAVMFYTAVNMMLRAAQ